MARNWRAAVAIQQQVGSEDDEGRGAGCSTTLEGFGGRSRLRGS
jgi:hypothetical protein